MELRRLNSTDRPAMDRLHASMQLGYDLPENFFVKLGIFDGPLRVALLGRKTSEAYLLLDQNWSSPRERWDAIQRLIVTGAQQAKLDGIDDVNVWLPPSVENRFAKRLADFAFVKAPWNCYTARL
ncbi:MAG TPA: hypothetical protein VIW68_12700 [Candidatus Sulfotelmatobacter sp.]